MRRSTKMRYVYEARRFKRLARLSRLADATPEIIARFARDAIRQGYSPRTVASSIRAVSRLSRRKFETPDEALGDAPVRHIPRLMDLARLYDAADDPLRQVIVVAYVTALRLGDLMRLSVRDVAPDHSRIEMTVSKTERSFCCPIPPGLRHWLTGPKRPADYRIGREMLLRTGRKGLYAEIHGACKRAGVKPITPHAIRRLSACQYETAYPGAGRAILGHSSGVTGRYIPDSVIIERAQERLAIPWLGPDEQAASAEMTLVESFRRLPPPEKDAVLRIVGRIAE
jgi:integrase